VTAAMVVWLRGSVASSSPHELMGSLWKHPRQFFMVGEPFQDNVGQKDWANWELRHYNLSPCATKAELVDTIELHIFG